MREVMRRAKKGVPILGICNGFQVLIESGLLPGALMRNSTLKYVCKDTYLKVTTNKTIFTGNYDSGQIIQIPISHGDGNYFAEEVVLDRLEDKNCIAFRYVDEQGNQTETANPNGSLRNIAGILSEDKKILGMMPHPERACDKALGGEDGVALFESLLSMF